VPAIPGGELLVHIVYMRCYQDACPGRGSDSICSYHVIKLILIYIYILKMLFNEVHTYICVTGCSIISRELIYTVHAT
jgi:hypothetical protein